MSIDPKNVKLIASYPTSAALFSMCLDEKSKTLYGAGSDGALYTVDLSLEKPASVKKATLHENYVSTMALHGDQVISGGFDRKLVWTDRHTGKRIRAIEAHAGWVRKLVLSPDGKVIISVGDDMLVKVWDADTGKPILSLPGHATHTPEGYLSALYTVAITSDGKQLASADRSGFIHIWETGSGKLLSTFRASELYTFDAVKRARAMGGPRGLAFSSDGSVLAISGIGPVTNVDGFVGPSRIELWSWQTGKLVAFAQDKHLAILNHVIFDGSELIAVGGGDSGGAIVFWEGKATANTSVAKPKGHLHSVTLNSKGTHLYAAGHGGFQVWQIRTS
jgi:WD40 repeat protein